MSEVGFGCFGNETITVCSPRGIRYRAIRYCRKCKRRRRSLVTLFDWYDPGVECCTCRKSGAKWREERTTRKQAVRAICDWALLQKKEEP
jgi:hypothetical protein